MTVPPDDQLDILLSKPWSQLKDENMYRQFLSVVAKEHHTYIINITAFNYCIFLVYMLRNDMLYVTVNILYSVEQEIKIIHPFIHMYHH